MDKIRIWVIGSVMLMVAVVVLGWFLGVQPQLAAAAAAHEQRAAAEVTNQQHAVQTAKLKEDFAGIDTLNRQLAALADSVPSGTNVPDFVDQLGALEAANHVTLTGITVADAQPYTPVEPPVEAAPADTAGGTDSAAAPTTPTTPTTPAAPTASTIVPGAPPVTNALITGDNFAALAVQIMVTGSYSDILNFVHGLQTGTRLVLVDGLTTGESSDNPALRNATISGLIYSIVTPTTPEVVGAG